MKPGFLLPHGAGGRRSAYGYEIANSLRFDDGSTQHLDRTFGTDDGDDWSLSMWYKAGDYDANNMGLFTESSVEGFYTVSTGALRLYDGAAKNTTRLFRDPSGFYHIFVKNTASGSTLYVNGSEVTVASSPAITKVNRATKHTIGDSTAGGNALDGYLAEIAFVSDQALDPTDFGEFDSNNDGLWRPKDLSGVDFSSGTNSFHLDFEDGADLGKDVSGNGNDWTPSGSPKQSEDTPTKNHSKMLSNLKNSGSYALTYAEANERISRASGGQAMAHGSLAFDASDHFYYEVLVNTVSSGTQIGIMPASETTTEMQESESQPGGAPNGYGYEPSAGNVVNNESGSAYGDTYTTSDVIGIRVDSGSLYFYKNGTIQNSGTAAATGLTGKFFPAVSTESGGDLDIRIEEADWTQAPGVGEKAVHSRNLTNPTIKDPQNAVAVTTATEGNIESDVATARSGWSDYVDILKNRDSVEDWAWRFSHDSSNEYAVSTTATYQATRTLSGSNNWVGLSIRIGAAYGTAAGSESHTNGAATTVTHNLGTTDVAIFLFPRNNGEVPAYHPALTSGSLLELTGTGAEAADTAITNITSNSFDIGSGEATDTYDYLVIAETAGLTSLKSHEGNGNADGPVTYCDGRSLAVIVREIDASGSWVFKDRVRDDGNPNTAPLYLDSNTSEGGSGRDIDFTATGYKIRAAASDTNTNASTYLSIAFLDGSVGGELVPPATAV